jgi:hypothetical protein
MKNNKLNKTNLLPEDFTEDDKIEYEVLVAESKRIYDYIDDFSIHIAVIAYINEKKGKKQEYTDEDLKTTMMKYDDNTRVYNSPTDPEFYEDIEKQASDILRNKILLDNRSEDNE